MGSPVRVLASGAPVPSVVQGTSLRRRLYQNRYFYLFIAPFFVLFLGFHLFPILFSLLISFSDWKGLGVIGLRGLDNYVNLVTENDDFHQAIVNTLVLLVGSRGLLIVIALGMAYLLHLLHPRYDHVYRVSYFLPLLVSSVAIAQIFVALFDQQSGLVNFLLSLVLGKHLALGWLIEEGYGKIVVTLELWWQWIGWTIVVLVASMEAIPIDLYQAAQVDGAGRWALFRHIVLPLLQPIMLFITITSVIGGFQMFAEVFALWGSNNGLGTPTGGPGNTAMTTTVYLYEVAFAGGRYGFGAAVSWLMFLMIGAFSFANYRMVTRQAAE